MVGKQKSSTRALSLCIHNWQVLSATLEQCYISNITAELLADQIDEITKFMFLKW